MKFLKLEMLNLASLDRKDGEIIDFEQGALGDSSIFSIVGPTGSGKSTILDAICLALYNRAPRYPRKKGEKNQNIEIYGTPEASESNRLAPTDCRNMLTRGRKNGYSKLTFLANNGKVYRAEWSVRFNRVKYDNVVTALYEICADGKEVQAAWEDLPAIIGLDFDQFLSTVLIAQGSFAKFIGAKENERYELLEKLIGCEELYSGIAKEIKQQKEAAVREFDKVMSDCAAYGKDIIIPEDIAPLKERIKMLEDEENKDKAELVTVTESLAWFTTERKHHEDIELYKIAKSEAEKALESAKSDMVRLGLHDATLAAVALYKSISESQKTIGNLENELKSLEEKISGKESEIKNGNTELESLKKAEIGAASEYDKHKPHIDKARTLKGELYSASKVVIEKEEAQIAASKALDIAKKEVAGNTTAIKQAEKGLREATDAFNGLKTEVDRQKEVLAGKAKLDAEAYLAENAKLEGLDAAKLQEAKSLAEQKKHDLKEAIRILGDIKSKTRSIALNGNNMESLSKRNVFIDSELKSLSMDKITKELETLHKTYTLMTSEAWATHRHGLEDGKPCPLCGATSHPYSSDDALIPITNDLSRLISEKQDALARQTEKKETLTAEQAENKGKIKGYENNNKTLSSELEVLKEQWTDLHSRYGDWSDDLDLLKTIQPVVDMEAKHADDALTACNHLISKLEQLRKAMESSAAKQAKYIEEADRSLRDAEQKLNRADTLLKTEQGKTANLIKQEDEKTETLKEATEAWKKASQAVEDKKAAIKAEIGDKDPDTFEQELSKAKAAATNAVKTKEEAIGKLREEQQGLKGNCTSTGNSLSGEKAKLEKNTTSLSEWLSGFNGRTGQQLAVSDISALYSASDDWEAIRTRQHHLNTALTSAATTLKNEETAHARHQEAKPESTEDELKSKKTELEGRAHVELTDAKARLQRHETASEKLGGLAGQKQAVELQKREWEEISDAIGTDGKTLRKIAQCYTLRFLIEHANAEIRKFNSRYELQQVKNSLGIRVIDHDRADDVRDTTSLSGGETFIVSLGLALGLSSLSSKNISFENLFIDEGFGTLDPDALATVIDSLAMLQSSQGKKVGVISHTNTMSERITTQIRIVKNGNSGSSHIEFNP